MELNDIKVLELSQCEMSVVDGGESAWYWIAYGAGVVASGVQAFAMGASEGGYAKNKTA